MPVYGAYACSPTHFVQVLRPAAVLYLPFMHGVQLEADMGEYVPGAHSRQKCSCVAAVVGENKPAAHSIHTVCLEVV